MNNRKKIIGGIIISVIVLTSIAVSQVGIETAWEVEIFMNDEDSVTLAGAGTGDSDIVQIVPAFNDDSDIYPSVAHCSCSEEVISNIDENIGIFIEFSKPMTTPPQIRFSQGDFNSMGGIWENGNTQWTELFEINSIKTPHVNVIININGAVDTFGNRMEDYMSEPLFDIVSPCTSHYIFSIDDGVYLDYDSQNVDSLTNNFQLGYIWFDKNETVDTVTLTWNVDERMFRILTMNIMDNEINMLETDHVEIEIVSNELYGFTIKSVPAIGITE